MDCTSAFFSTDPAAGWALFPAGKKPGWGPTAQACRRCRADWQCHQRCSFAFCARAGVGARSAGRPHRKCCASSQHRNALGTWAAQAALAVFAAGQGQYGNLPEAVA